VSIILETPHFLLFESMRACRGAHDDNVLLAPALVALGVAGLRATALPRWLTWSALVIGLAMAVPSLAQLVQLVLLVWVVVVAVLYLIRPAGVAAESVPPAEANSPPPT
jgi:hypothetical protein